LSDVFTFLEKEYEETDEGEDPIVPITINVNGKEHTIPAYADTGCSSGIAITKQMATKIGITKEDRYSNREVEVCLADGSIMGAYLYGLNIVINGRTFFKKIPIIEPDRFLGMAHNQDETTLLGRGIMDEFSVIFQGNCTPKKKLHFKY